MFKVQATLLALLVLCASCAEYTVQGDWDNMIRKSWGLSGVLTTQSPNSKVVINNKVFIDLDPKGHVIDDESGYYTVQFGVIPPPGGAYDATATVTFKVNGQPVTRKVSVGQGTSISGICEAIDVIVEDTSADFAAVIPAGRQYTVSASFVKGTRGATSLPPTLKGIASNPTGGTVLRNNGAGEQVLPATTGTIDYVIPQGVGVASVEVAVLSEAADPNTATAVEVGILDSSGAVLIKAWLANSSQLPIFVDVPAGASLVRLSNVSAANGAQIALTWGIDG